MLIDKAELLRTLRTVQTFDNNASPFVGVQLLDDNPPRLYRSSAFGFICSKEFCTTQPTNVSLAHFQERLKALREEKVELSLDLNGLLKISSTDNTFDSELRVHTVPASQAGLKSHNVGDVTVRLGATVFQGIDPTPFKVKTLPVLAEGRLMLATADAVVIWTGPDSLKAVPSYPRESFLRMACSNPKVKDVLLSANGYWGVLTEDLEMFSYGHNVGRELFNAYNIPGTELVRLPAERLLYSLQATAILVGDRDRVEIDPKHGITSKDRFGADSKFSLGGVSGWTKFGIFGGTAQAIVDALSQSKDEEAVLYSVPMLHPTMRLRRGPFEVNFKVI